MKNKLPAGWSEDKVKQVINHYETQSENEAVTKDEEAFAVKETRAGSCRTGCKRSGFDC